MTYNQEAEMRSLRGAQNRKEGEVFEELIEKACFFYMSRHTANIEKTPEPMKILRSMGEGKFLSCFTKSAQPDFKGTLRGGQAICFDAKATSTEKIPVSALSQEQVSSLAEHTLLGANTGVILCFSFRTFAYIPCEVLMRAKELNGHKHWTEQDAEPYRVSMYKGYLDFLNMSDIYKITDKREIKNV